MASTFAVGGTNIFPINPFTSQPWTRSDLSTLLVGNFARWDNLTNDPQFPQRLLFNDFTVEVRYRDGPVPTLTVDGAVVDRFGRVTFTVNAEPNAVVTNWRFTGAIGAVQRTTNTGTTTWQGRIASPGVVSVRVEQNGEAWDLSQTVDVNPRNWAWTPVPARRANALTTFISPPAPRTRIGISGLEVGFRSSPAERIADQGPNHGFIFIERFTDVSRDPRRITRFRYQLSDDLNKNAAFYKAQCGTWSAQNPGGVIRNTTLLANLEEHEFGTITGHYQQYIAALQLPTDNLGAIAEALIGTAEQSLAAYEEELNGRLLFAGGRLIGATNLEACNEEASYDPSCAVVGQPAAFRGFVNYFPYASCP